uniref:Uncharacterized protein n=1 Tax=Rhizophora mucronata TaxID=61149 RepID=A0A2P2NV97_RHIMU
MSKLLLNYSVEYYRSLLRMNMPMQSWVDISYIRVPPIRHLL